MLANMRLMPQEEDNDDEIEVTWEDQQRINSFSKLNSKLKIIEEKLEEFKQEREALDDIAMELELADEDEPVLYRVGETFLHIKHSRALKRLAKDQLELATRMDDLSSQASDCEKGMKELKVILYAKFGRAINLDE